ncbi:MAG: hypothetical protein EOP93_24650, partial [Lysobacteraceae bacterium]
MSHALRHVLALAAAFALSPVDAQTRDPTRAAAPLLHPLFQDHAVLQRDQPIVVWGWTRWSTAWS